MNQTPPTKMPVMMFGVITSGVPLPSAHACSFGQTAGRWASAPNAAIAKTKTATAAEV
eukprot:CAMPEP_0176104378 /NCGR_PEP_ID=MMETSP0120_2-20121206/52374_1 /TAXON_ID=160619 /ORGANISM="Kryptoperidinium foliaceum, Strain CCMP 1326" /LENGTH=57 /DNA_ID=CAMNT_0017438481 /DNA_START=102 /DNA_END=272 /DNA_ORIENTATION=+